MFYLAMMVQYMIRLLLLGMLITALMSALLPTSAGLTSLITNIGIGGFLSASLFTGIVADGIYQPTKWLLSHIRRTV